MTTLAAISDQSEIRDPRGVLLIALAGLVVYAILCAHQRATERASRRARDRARHPAVRHQVDDIVICETIPGLLDVDPHSLADAEFMTWAKAVSPPCMDFSHAAQGRGWYADLGTIALDPEMAELVRDEFIKQTKADQT